jgi:hypothetical protein
VLLFKKNGEWQRHFDRAVSGSAQSLSSDCEVKSARKLLRQREIHLGKI